MATLAAAVYDGGESSAIIVPGQPKPLEISYQGLLADVNRFQKCLADLGIKPGEAISIATPNSYDFVVAFLAATLQRAIAAPLNPAYKEDEFEFYIKNLGSVLVLVPRGSLEQDSPPVRAAKKNNAAVAECYWDDVKHEVVLHVKAPGALNGRQHRPSQTPVPDDVALVLHTSGTTGRPKAVPLTHKNLTRTMGNIRDTYQLVPDDRTLLVMPLFHVHGLLAGLLAPLSCGSSVVIPARFSASEFWRLFITYKANWYTAVPTIHQILLKTPPPEPKPYIRFIRSCSSPLSPAAFHQLENVFGAPVLEAYAMTEAAHQMTSNPLPPGTRKPGSVGLGQGVSVRILDAEGDEVLQSAEGEICIRGENVTSGYINNPEANRSSFTKTGFFRTGDQGRKDEEGYVFITGRIKELINKGGEKISPVELDNAIANHPAVAEIVTFAIPDDMYGQEVGAAIVLKQRNESDTPDLPQQRQEEELRQWLAQKVAKFKMPKQIFFISHMPKTATGKIQRRLVAEQMLKS